MRDRQVLLQQEGCFGKNINAETAMVIKEFSVVCIAEQSLVISDW